MTDLMKLFEHEPGSCYECDRNRMLEQLRSEVREWKRRYLLALEGKFLCKDCGAQMETDGERLALRCERCCPK